LLLLPLEVSGVAPVLPAPDEVVLEELLFFSLVVVEVSPEPEPP